jgi:predicted ATPase
MIINKIKLVNFKNFDTVEVSLNQMNVIVGANASGKSNFIQALKFLRDIKDFGIENAISLQGGIEYFKNIQIGNNKPTTISIEFLYPQGYDYQHFTDYNQYILNIVKTIFTLEVTMTKNTFFIKEQIVCDTELRYQDREAFIYRHTQEMPFLDNLRFVLNLEKNKIKLTHPIKGKYIVYLPNGTTHAINKKFLTLFPDTFLEYSATVQKSLLEQLPSFLPIDKLGIYDFDLKKAKSSTPITGKADLEENGENLAIVLRTILKDKEKSRIFSNLMKDMLPFIKQLDTDKFYDNSLLFKVKEIYNHNTFIPSALLSDGTISVTAIMVALFFQNKSLAIFEEPEHGLHPALIAQLMQLFYSAAEKKQIIVTTHNPEVLKHTRLEDLLLVSRNEKGFAILTKPAEQTMVKAFLENELGIDQLFIQNLLDA